MTTQKKREKKVFSDEVLKKISVQLKKERVASGLSQTKLSVQAGLSPKMVGLIERRECRPTVVTFKKICDIMNINMSDMLKKIGE